MRTLIDKNNTYMTPFIMTLTRILQFYYLTSFVEF